MSHTIDCDADPFCPRDWKVEEHKKGGQFVWSKEKAMLHHSRRVIFGGSMPASDLRKELDDKPVMNANVLDFLLNNPELIPDSWKRGTIYFWGTTYRDSRGHVLVRGLVWGLSADWIYCDLLDTQLDALSPAAIYAQ